MFLWDLYRRVKAFSKISNPNRGLTEITKSKFLRSLWKKKYNIDKTISDFLSHCVPIQIYVFVYLVSAIDMHILSPCLFGHKLFSLVYSFSELLTTNYIFILTFDSSEQNSYKHINLCYFKKCLLFSNILCNNNKNK